MKVVAEVGNMNDDKRERLVMLIEECGEVIQAATKVLRHGYENHRPGRTNTNKEDLEWELRDVASVVAVMAHYGDIDRAPIHEESLTHFNQEKLKWTDFQVRTEDKTEFDKWLDKTIQGAREDLDFDIDSLERAFYAGRDGS